MICLIASFFAAGVKANDDVLAMGYKTGIGTRMDRDVSPPLRLPLLLHDRRGVSAAGGGGGSVASSVAVVSSEAEEASPIPRSEALDDFVNNNDKEIRDEVRVKRLGVALYRRDDEGPVVVLVVVVVEDDDDTSIDSRRLASAAVVVS